MLFPCLSLLTGISSLIYYFRFKKHTSAVFIPFIGPVFLSGLILHSGKPLWLIPIVWIADVGTLAFLWVSPRLIADWWNICGLTRILTLRGTQGIQSAALTLHSTGHYLLEKSWQRTPDELGICGLGETGTYRRTENDFELIAHHGLRRFLRAAGNGTYLVDEGQTDAAADRNCSLNGWASGGIGDTGGHHGSVRQSDRRRRNMKKLAMLGVAVACVCTVLAEYTKTRRRTSNIEWGGRASTFDVRRSVFDVRPENASNREARVSTSAWLSGWKT